MDNRVIGVRFLVGARDLSILHSVHTGYGPLPATCQMGTRAVYPGLKRPAREGDHSPPSSAQVMNAWNHTSTSHTPHDSVLNYV
jgi:hypothetical protein